MPLVVINYTSTPLINIPGKLWKHPNPLLILIILNTQNATTTHNEKWGAIHSKKRNFIADTLLHTLKSKGKGDMVLDLFPFFFSFFFYCTGGDVFFFFF